MAPDKNNGHGKTDKILKAVILADAFNDLFQPLSLNKPRCLLPLCNVPMIEYTLEFLASSGVKETLVVCKSHVDAIKEYLWQSKWASSLSTMKIKTSVVKSANTLGEALRELDETPFVSDFILCTGVVIANINIADIVNMHVENPDKDKVVTMVLQETTSEHRARDKSEEVVYVIEPRTNRLLTLDSATTLPETKIMDLPLEVITDHPEIEIRNDLMDTNVYVCSPKIFALFKDSFDYQTMRSDFIQKTSISELESATFYAHVLEGTNGLHAEAPRAPINKTSASAGRGRGDKGSAKTEDLADDSAAFTNHSGYLAGVVDTSAYDAISRDLIARWAYPLCPDSNPVDPLTYSYYRGAVYKAESVVLARESRVDHHVILGTNSKVADFARVSNAVLGADCSIGERSIVRGSYLFEGAQVGRNSVVEGCILGERAVILDNVILERGCIIGDDVVIGPNVRLAPFTRIGRWMQEM
ncbi:translation initiation factor eIF-2B epsilon subunit, GEF, partial [Coemansia sp. Benny D115]